MKATSFLLKSSGNSRGKSHSLVVALTGSTSSITRLSSRLKELLIRRGFRVELLRNRQEDTSPECDITLIPCQEKNLDTLANQIEKSWTQQWLNWYTTP